MAPKIDFPYIDKGSVYIGEENLYAIVEPNSQLLSDGPTDTIIRKALENPIGSRMLRDEILGCSKVLILSDDYTRQTPMRIILPILLQELEAGGVQSNQVTILVASGTHRAMTVQEKIQKFGEDIVGRIQIIDHRWYDPSCLSYLGTTDHGTEMHVNSLLLESDFIIGIGHIVPHRVAGFSGGAKIVQPGVCGEVTTGQTHWLSARKFCGKEIMGVVDNEVRREINEVGKRSGLRFIINTVQTGHGAVSGCYCGDPVMAFEKGCSIARTILGCKIPGLADIVIVDAYPSHMNMWQAAKGIFSADIALKADGVLILVASCIEGVAKEHPDVEMHGYGNIQEISNMVERGAMKDLTVAAHILHVGSVIAEPRIAFLVSEGLTAERTEHLGFRYASTIQAALASALSIKGKSSSVTVIRNGGEVLPILEVG